MRVRPGNGRPMWYDATVDEVGKRITVITNTGQRLTVKASELKHAKAK